MQRLEWIFGIPQVVYSSAKKQFGVGMVELVGDEYCKFKSSLSKGQADAFLGLLFKAKGRMDT